MWDLDYKESWALKNWCFWTVVLEKTLESPLDCKEIQPLNPQGNQSWIFIGRTDAEAEAPILWPPDAKSWLTGKDCDAGRDWGQGEERAAEDEMVREHHWLNGHETEQTLGVGGRQRSLACCSPWGQRVRHNLATEQQQQQKYRYLAGGQGSCVTAEPRLRNQMTWLQNLVPLVTAGVTWAS